MTNIKQDVNFEFNLPPGAPPFNSESKAVVKDNSFKIDIKEFDDSTFIMVDKVPLQLLEISSFYAAILDQWIKLDGSSFYSGLYGANLYPMNYGVADFGNEFGGQLSQKEYDELKTIFYGEATDVFSNAEYLKNIESQGKEYVAGIETEIFSFSLNLENLSDAAVSYVENVDKQLEQSDNENLRQLANSVDKKYTQDSLGEINKYIKGIDAKFWISTDNQEMKKMDFSVEISLASFADKYEELKNGMIKLSYVMDIKKTNADFEFFGPPNYIDLQKAENLSLPKEKLDDADNDGLATYLEEAMGTNPQDYDTDSDGVGDGEELKQATNPLGSGGLQDRYGDPSLWMSLFYIPIQQAKQKSFDIQRISAMKQLATAMEVYADDTGSYPVALDALVPIYLQSVPKDPKTGEDYYYSYRRDGKGYHLGIKLDDGSNSALAIDSDMSSTGDDRIRINGWNGSGADPVFDYGYEYQSSGQGGTTMRDGVICSERSEDASLTERIIKSAAQPEIYLVKNGKKLHVSTWQNFTSFGYRMSDVEIISYSEMSSYPRLSLAYAVGNDALYYLTQGDQKKKISNNETFYSYVGNACADITGLTRAEIDMFPDIKLFKMEGYQDVYILDGDSKRLIVDPATYKRYGLDPGKIHLVNPTEFNYYIIGEPLK